MEISKNSDKSVKIKLKKITIVTDPEKKIEADIAIITDSIGTNSVYDDYQLVIEGPGKYEKNGIYIRGEKVGNSVTYEILDGATKIHFAPSNSLEKFKEEDDINVLIIKAVGKIDESIFASFSSSIMTIFGPEELLQLSSESVRRVSKVNLKSREEYAGNVLILSA